MFEERSLKLDVFALVLLAATVFLVIALWSFSPADPPSALVYPPSTHVANACGRSGAFVAYYLFEFLGFASYYVVASLGVLTGLLLMRRQVNEPFVRGTGWCLSLISLTTLAAMAMPGITPGPVIGAGGYLGALCEGLLEMNFATTGAYILTLSVLLAGLLLCTDYLLLRLTASGVMFSARGLLMIGRVGHAAAERGRPADERGDAGEADDEEEEWEEEDDEGLEDEYEEEYEGEDEEEEQDADAREIRVRTPGSELEDPEQADASTEEDASPTRQTVGRVKNRIASALRITRPKKTEHEDVIDQLEAADQQVDEQIDYELPPLDLLLQSDDVSYEEHAREVRRKAKILERTFANFGFRVRVVEIETGPVIAQYEVELEAGLRLSKITSLADDLAIALRVPSVRIVAPLPGKNTVGIEVPNENRQLVRLREVIEETNGRAKRMKIPIYLGKDVAGNPMVVDLAALPHLLIAGRTGTGKSVCLNSIIVSLLMGRGPDEVRLLLVDPKMVELSQYKKLPHLMHPVVTDMKKAEAILAWAVDKMEERYALLARAGVRHVSIYNQLSEEELRERIAPESDEEWTQIPGQLPFIVIIADEMADLMMTAGKDAEQHIIRLAQKSRAVGIHLILATQKPTVDVITGLIKSNLPARIAFQVASRTDSRVVLDEMGADKLLGNGDMLFLSPGTSTLLRGQGTYLSDDEITRIVDFVGTTEQQFASELVHLKTKDELETAGPGKLKNRDELYESAVDVVVREQRGSVSLLQRTLGVGYGRAARLIDYMAEDGIVGEYNGSQARDVLISLEEWEAMNGDESAASPPTPESPATKRSNRISLEPEDAEPGASWAGEAGRSEPAGPGAPASSSKRRGALALAVEEDDSLEAETPPWEEQDSGELEPPEEVCDEECEDEYEEDYEDEYEEEPLEDEEYADEAAEGEEQDGAPEELGDASDTDAEQEEDEEEEYDEEEYDDEEYEDDEYDEEACDDEAYDDEEEGEYEYEEEDSADEDEALDEPEGAEDDQLTAEDDWEEDEQVDAQAEDDTEEAPTAAPQRRGRRPPRYRIRRA